MGFLIPEIEDDEPLTQQEKRLAERRKQVLAQVAATSGLPMPKGQMVGKFYAPPTLQEYAVPAMGHYIAQQDLKQLNKEQTAHDIRVQQAQADYLKNLPANRQVEVQGPPAEGEGPPTQTVSPTREEQLAYAAKGLGIPGLRETITKQVEDLLIEQPKRDQEQAFKSREAQAQRDTYGPRDQIELVDGPDGQVYAVNKQEGTAKLIPGVTKQTKEAYHFVTDDSGNVVAIDKKDPTKRVLVGSVGRTTQPPSYQLVTGQGGDVTAVNPKDPRQTVSVGPIGKPSPTPAGKDKMTPQQREAEVNRLLDQADNHVKTATGSYIGMGRDFLGKVVGQSTEGSRSSAALKTIAGQLIAQMPRMEGPQSDRDVLLYRQMAGMLDSDSTPTEDKIAAIKQIRELNKKYSGGTGGEGGATGSWDKPSSPPSKPGRKKFNPATGRLE